MLFNVAVLILLLFVIEILIYFKSKDVKKNLQNFNVLYKKIDILKNLSYLYSSKKIVLEEDLKDYMNILYQSEIFNNLSICIIDITEESILTKFMIDKRNNQITVQSIQSTITNSQPNPENFSSKETFVRDLIYNGKKLGVASFKNIKVVTEDDSKLLLTSLDILIFIILKHSTNRKYSLNQQLEVAGRPW